MSGDEIDEIARRVAERLKGSTTATGVPPYRPTASGMVGTWEVPDIGWRMPIAGAGARPATRDQGSGIGREAREAAATAKPPRRQAAERGPGEGQRRGAVRIADYVDHTLLKAEATREQIEALCSEAAEHRFAAVCVNGCWVPLCRRLLAGTGVKLAAVVGFPLGAMTSEAKAAEGRQLVELGADELDMVAAVGHIVGGDWDYVEDDIRAVVDAARARTVKVILETAALEPLQVVKAAAIVKEAGAHFVKTSTGFHPAGGATADAVALMRLVVGDELGVKAAGGIRDCATALRMVAAGANRIGTSSGVKFVECLGRGAAPLAELLSAPERHEPVCATGDCPSSY